MTLFNDARKLRRAMEEAQTYADWLAAAEQLDRVEGHDLWRADASSSLFHHTLLAEHLGQLRTLRETEHVGALARTIQESLHRHLGEISNPELYTHAHTGTKHLICAYLEECDRAIRFIAQHDTPGLPVPEKLRHFEQAAHNFGGTALILSGGLAFGIYHMGVIKALWEQRLLPTVISGSSMGAIVAAVTCTRTDDELAELFRHPERVHVNAIKLASPSQILKQRKLLDSEQLRAHIVANVPDLTFKEAFEHSGRILNITVSPTRSRQKPRVLNHLTAPNVMVTQSALASCAMPPGFAPVMLQERDANGQVVPYLPTERWIDGSLHGDIPMLRLSRLLNVNHSIVSQANPHVVPFLHQERVASPLSKGWSLASSMVQAQAAEVLGASQALWRVPVGRSLLEKAHAVTAQHYLGDINIQFPFRPTLYRKMLSNPDLEGFKNYIRLGEQATWPQLAIVRDQTRLSRAFEAVIAALKPRVAGDDVSLRGSD